MDESERRTTDGGGADRKNPVEQAADVFIYAPLGLALEVRNLLPQLVERGRREVTLARMIGHFTVRKGQKDATKVIGRAGVQANTVLGDLGLLNRVVEPGKRSNATTAGTSAAPAPAAGAEAANAAAEPVEQVAAPIVARPAHASDGLAIADYDSLAASQVIPRLPGLSSEELEAVRDYEMANRGRKTVLNRIAQLQSA